VRYGRLSFVPLAARPDGRGKEWLVHETVPSDLDGKTIHAAYRRWAPIYDMVWGAVLETGRKAAAEAANAVGGRVLEIGIGTGLSLRHYNASSVELYGIDASPDMLGKAKARARSGRYPHLRRLELMDAHCLAFGNRFFDCAVAQYVITLVESPEQVLSECARVVRPGGEIILVSHFYSERGLTAGIERMLAARVHRMGLRPEFRFARLEHWAKQDGRAELLGRNKVGLLGDTVARFRRV